MMAADNCSRLMTLCMQQPREPRREMNNAFPVPSLNNVIEWQLADGVNSGPHPACNAETVECRSGRHSVLFDGLFLSHRETAHTHVTTGCGVDLRPSRQTRQIRQTRRL